MFQQKQSLAQCYAASSAMVAQILLLEASSMQQNAYQSFELGPFRVVIYLEASRPEWPSVSIAQHLGGAGVNGPRGGALTNARGQKVGWSYSGPWRNGVDVGPVRKPPQQILRNKIKYKDIYHKFRHM